MERPKDIPADANILYDVETCNGKYRFVIIEDQPPRAYRLGQPWQAFSNIMLGSGAIYSLIAELSERGERETSPEVASIAGRIMAGGNPLDNEQVIASIKAALPADLRPTDDKLREALALVLTPYFDNMLSLAGSALGQKE